MTAKTCCVTGHRALPPGRQLEIASALRDEVLRAVEDGYTRFISGFASGVDLMFAEIVDDLARENPALELHAAIPYRGRLHTRDPVFRRLIARCKDVRVYSETYSSDCYFVRNRAMVEQSQRVIAVYDGRSRGGTAYTIRRAYELGREVRLVLI
ncbi:MAG: DUF1273 domain-containing protein [Clostridiales bacterium]|nr:DUF1273 domain-containing protein [Clostridiales bacterium]